MAGLIIRADASPTIGAGHIMRCLALAQAAVDRGVSVQLLSYRCPAPLAARLRAEGISLVEVEAVPGSADDAAEVVAMVVATQADWIVVDGYSFDREYLETLSRCPSAGVMALDDDMRQRGYPVDVLLNQNPLATPEWYESKITAVLLLGAEHALIRREFKRREFKHRQAVPESTHERPVSRLLITMGGSDPRALALPLLSVLRRSHPEMTKVVVCGGDPSAELVQLADGASDVELQVAVDDMAALIASCDACITAAGSTLFELCVVGRPFACIVVADNQAQNAQWVKQSRVGMVLGRWDALDWDAVGSQLERWLADREELANSVVRAARVIDGSGADRVWAALEAINL